MIDLDEWRPLAMAALRETFGERLLCVGLQGSYLRGEARPDSDIDLLVVLDHVELTDLDRFHEAMRAVPEGGKAVGFTCGRDELAAGPPMSSRSSSTAPRSGMATCMLCFPSMGRPMSGLVRG